MWVLQKVRAGAENLPVQINHLISKNKEDVSAKTNIFNNLHNNVLTPDKIPDFFLPPKLTKRSLVLDTEKISQCLDNEIKVPNSAKTSVSSPGAAQQLRSSLNKCMALNKLKPVPYSLKCFECGLFETPNTRRKESLFHSALTSYTMERITVRTRLSCSPVLKKASTESDTPSSDSSPYSTPPLIRRQDFTGEQSISEDPFQQNIHISMDDKKKVYATPDKKSKVSCCTKVIQTSSRFTRLAPPIQFPLDMLHCQERFHQEHVLPLPQRGRVRISASRSSAAGGSTTIRIRVVSVEGLREPSDHQPLTCSLTLSLTPGKLQSQHSAIIRNCRNPVFNEDFFFQEPEEHLALRLKVLDKSSGLGRGVVLGIVTKPLCQLLPL